MPNGDSNGGNNTINSSHSSQQETDVKAIHSQLSNRSLYSLMASSADPNLERVKLITLQNELNNRHHEWTHDYDLDYLIRGFITDKNLISNKNLITNGEPVLAQGLVIFPHSSSLLDNRDLSFVVTKFNLGKQSNCNYLVLPRWKNDHWVLHIREVICDDETPIATDTANTNTLHPAQSVADSPANENNSSPKIAVNEGLKFSLGETITWDPYIKGGQSRSNDMLIHDSWSCGDWVIACSVFLQLGIITVQHLSSCEELLKVLQNKLEELAKNNQAIDNNTSLESLEYFQIELIKAFISGLALKGSKNNSFALRVALTRFLAWKVTQELPENADILTPEWIENFNFIEYQTTAQPAFSSYRRPLPLVIPDDAHQNLNALTLVEADRDDSFQKESPKSALQIFSPPPSTRVSSSNSSPSKNDDSPTISDSNSLSVQNSPVSLSSSSSSPKLFSFLSDSPASPKGIRSNRNLFFHAWADLFSEISDDTLEQIYFEVTLDDNDRECLQKIINDLKSYITSLQKSEESEESEDSEDSEDSINQELLLLVGKLEDSLKSQDKAAEPQLNLKILKSLYNNLIDAYEDDSITKLQDLLEKLLAGKRFSQIGSLYLDAYKKSSDNSKSNKKTFGIGESGDNSQKDQIKKLILANANRIGKINGNRKNSYEADETILLSHLDEIFSYIKMNNSRFRPNKKRNFDSDLLMHLYVEVLNGNTQARFTILNVLDQIKKSIEDEYWLLNPEGGFFSQGSQLYKIVKKAIEDLQASNRALLNESSQNAPAADFIADKLILNSQQSGKNILSSLSNENKRDISPAENLELVFGYNDETSKANFYKTIQRLYFHKGGKNGLFVQFKSKYGDDKLDKWFNSIEGFERQLNSDNVDTSLDLNNLFLDNDVQNIELLNNHLAKFINENEVEKLLNNSFLEKYIDALAQNNKIFLQFTDQIEARDNALGISIQSQLIKLINENDILNLVALLKNHGQTLSKFLNSQKMNELKGYIKKVIEVWCNQEKYGLVRGISDSISPSIENYLDENDILSVIVDHINKPSSDEILTNFLRSLSDNYNEKLKNIILSPTEDLSVEEDVLLCILKNSANKESLREAAHQRIWDSMLNSSMSIQEREALFKSYKECLDRSELYIVSDISEIITKDEVQDRLIDNLLNLAFENQWNEELSKLFDIKLFDYLFSFMNAEEFAQDFIEKLLYKVTPKIVACEMSKGTEVSTGATKVIMSESAINLATVFKHIITNVEKSLCNKRTITTISPNAKVRQIIDAASIKKIKLFSAYCLQCSNQTTNQTTRLGQLLSQLIPEASLKMMKQHETSPQKMAQHRLTEKAKKQLKTSLSDAVESSFIINELNLQLSFSESRSIFGNPNSSCNKNDFESNVDKLISYIKKPEATFPKDIFNRLNIVLGTFFAEIRQLELYINGSITRPPSVHYYDNAFSGLRRLISLEASKNENRKTNLLTVIITDKLSSLNQHVFFSELYTKSYIFTGSKELNAKNNFDSHKRKCHADFFVMRYLAIKYYGTEADYQSLLPHRIKMIVCQYFRHGVHHLKNAPPMRLNLIERLAKIEGLTTSLTDWLSLDRPIQYEAHCALNLQKKFSLFDEVLLTFEDYLLTPPRNNDKDSMLEKLSKLAHSTQDQTKQDQTKQDQKWESLIIILNGAPKNQDSTVDSNLGALICMAESALESNGSREAITLKLIEKGYFEEATRQLTILEYTARMLDSGFALLQFDENDLAILKKIPNERWVALSNFSEELYKKIQSLNFEQGACKETSFSADEISFLRKLLNENGNVAQSAKFLIDRTDLSNKLSAAITKNLNKNFNLINVENMRKSGLYEKLQEYENFNVLFKNLEPSIQFFNCLAQVYIFLQQPSVEDSVAITQIQSLLKLLRNSSKISLILPEELLKKNREMFEFIVKNKLSLELKRIAETVLNILTKNQSINKPTETNNSTDITERLTVQSSTPAINTMENVLSGERVIAFCDANPTGQGKTCISSLESILKDIECSIASSELKNLQDELLCANDNTYSDIINKLVEKVNSRQLRWLFNHASEEQRQQFNSSVISSFFQQIFTAHPSTIKIKLINYMKCCLGLISTSLAHENIGQVRINLVAALETQTDELIGQIRIKLQSYSKFKNILDLKKEYNLNNLDSNSFEQLSSNSQYFKDKGGDLAIKYTIALDIYSQIIQKQTNQGGFVSVKDIKLIIFNKKAELEEALEANKISTVGNFTNILENILKFLSEIDTSEEYYTDVYKALKPRHGQDCASTPREQDCFQSIISSISNGDALTELDKLKTQLTRYLVGSPANISYVQSELLKLILEKKSHTALGLYLSSLVFQYNRDESILNELPKMLLEVINSFKDCELTEDNLTLFSSLIYKINCNSRESERESLKSQLLTSSQGVEIRLYYLVNTAIPQKISIIKSHESPHHENIQEIVDAFYNIRRYLIEIFGSTSTDRLIQRNGYFYKSMEKIIDDFNNVNLVNMINALGGVENNSKMLFLFLCQIHQQKNGLLSSSIRGFSAALNNKIVRSNLINLLRESISQYNKDPSAQVNSDLLCSLLDYITSCEKSNFLSSEIDTLISMCGDLASTFPS
ncbi:MAG: hypothetical protein KIT27_10680, partial [Legionellales bacterium]|nr:hypothetical protein [Legionellales bacterium]